MGEWSKAVGEYGEETVENFLKLIGWGVAPKGVSLGCTKPEKHSKDGSRETHGIDFYFSYLSPLTDSIRQNIHVSSKYTSNTYPKYPNSLLKDYANELSFTVECFKRSQVKADLEFGLRGYSQSQEEGVLFWLSNNTTSDDDLISKIGGAQISLESPLHALYVVDNKRISFILLAFTFTKTHYPNCTIQVFYPNTGKNVLPNSRKNFGAILPVEYLNTSILPLRVEKLDGQTGLLLFSIDAFSREDLGQILGLAQELSQSWSTFMVIAFPDYDELNHDPIVRELKLSFDNQGLMAKTQIASYVPTFKSLNQQL